MQMQHQISLIAQKCKRRSKPACKHWKHNAICYCPYDLSRSLLHNGNGRGLSVRRLKFERLCKVIIKNKESVPNVAQRTCQTACRKSCGTGLDQRAH